MLERPLVSVVMPVYNAGSYLEESIQSALNQEYQNIELILIDDGSTDQSPGIINKHESRDERIVSVRQENRGVSSARNAGLGLAKGEYIALLDADDICHPERILKQLEYMEYHQLDICGSGLEMFGDVKKTKTKMYPETDDELKFNLFFFGRTLPCSSVMMRRSAIQGMHFREDMDFAEDFEFWMTAVEKKRTRLGNIPESLIRYRVHRQQATKTLADNNRAVLTRIVSDILISNSVCSGDIDVKTHFDVIKERKKLSDDEFESYSAFLIELYNWLKQYCNCSKMYAKFLASFALGQMHLGTKVSRWLLSQEVCQQAGILDLGLRFRLNCQYVYHRVLLH